MKYLTNAYTYDFEARILSCIPYEGLYAITLSETYFYPEGGGQPGDHGFIDAFEIVDTIRMGAEIFHITQQPCPEEMIAKSVKCHIDSKRRLLLMQQHTGQHLLSAVAYTTFQANTVGFHIGDGYVTVDLDRKLTEKEVRSLESSINDFIFANKEIRIHYPTSEELETLPLRKMPKVTKDIRIVEIDDLDFSPCGGTHLRTTSEIGILKIRKYDHYKSGVRIEFVCGLLALQVFNIQNHIITKLMHLFSVPENEVLTFAENTLKLLKETKRNLSDLESQIITYEANAITKDYEDITGLKVIKLLEDQMGMNALRLKAQKITEMPNTIVLGISTEEGKQHIVLIKSKDLDKSYNMSHLFETYLKSETIKGGGNALIAQGGTTEPIDLEKQLAEIESHIEALIL
ncbi:alanyl-tRNA editing protein [Fusibacter tunisiensis]|uniref:Alanyl-tRNA synthetase n=1 Tax=Fusibacter tunisiensis TaxID=1008308 RepID=A0ABS2MMV0_9FIRM|nr:DHHA1 domain-containing protein [Fusibacter tunisiensis]MBM7560730.1 alanyl-tRNA synthetase [Fusibacter tunisiensis]